MRNESEDETNMPNERPTSYLKRGIWFVQRTLKGAFWVLGAVANVFGIYEFGDHRHWWDVNAHFAFSFKISPGADLALRTLAVAIGGPWAMALGVIASATLSGWFELDQSATNSIIHNALSVCFFFAALHCAQMMFGLPIFQDYLTGEGFVKVVSGYFIGGVGLGLITALVARYRGRNV